MTEPHETSAGETGGREALSDERLAEIRAHHDEYGFVGATDVDSVVVELLAEIERRRALEDSYIVALDQASIGDVQRAVARAEKAEAALERVRRQAQSPQAASGHIRGFVYAADVLKLLGDEEADGG